MANEQNLKVLSPSEARENGRKGGLASAEARRKKRAMRETLQELLAMPIAEGDLADITAAGSLKELDGYNLTVQEKILLEVILKAVAGDVRAAEFIRDTVEGKPAARGSLRHSKQFENMTVEELRAVLPVYIE